MAITFNESTVAGEKLATGAIRQRLLTRARLPDTSILLDRLTLPATGSVELGVGPDEIAWFQMLDGAATLTLDGHQEKLSDAHVAFLPPAPKRRCARPMARR